MASWRGSEQITAQAGSTIAKRHGAQRTDVQGEFVRDTNGRLIRGRLDRVVVMEKRTGWGAEYPDELRNGEWEYSIFNPDGVFRTGANIKACFECHKPKSSEDFIFSMPQLLKAAR